MNTFGQLKILDKIGKLETNTGLDLMCGYVYGILGPYIYEGTLNANRYLQFLRGTLLDYLHDVPLNQLQDMVATGWRTTT